MAPPRRAGLSAAQGGGWPHRCAVLSCVCTVALILAGGVVTSTGSGLAVPDWPTTFGYNMFLFPWSKMVGGIFIEHAHRLLGSLVGILTILTAAALLWKDERRWLRLLGLAAVALVIVQGVLGGMRVVLVNLDLAIVHACVAQIFFALMVSIALLTSRSWHEEAAPAPAPASATARLSLLTVVLLYLQIVLGALLRHTGEGLAAHVLFAAVSGACALVLCWRLLRRGETDRLTQDAHRLWVLLFVQTALGVASWLGKYAATSLSPALVVAFTSAHVLVGAMLFAAALLVALRLHAGGARTFETTEAPVAAGRARA